MRFAFFGTPDFSKEVLHSLVQKSFIPELVVTREDKPKGRSKEPCFSPVKEFALEHLPNVSLLQPKRVSDESSEAFIRDLSLDLFVVVAFGEIISKRILSLAKYGAINLHTSLLPKYRGAAPIQRAICAGETKTGVSIMYLDEKMDSGPVIAIREVPILEGDIFDDVVKKLLEEGKEVLIDVMKQFSVLPPKGEPQNESEVTFAPKITQDDLRIDFRKSALEIHNQIRAFSSYPGAFCLLETTKTQKRCKLFGSTVSSEEGSPGTLIRSSENTLLIATGSGSLSISEIQVEGKKRMKADEFLRGIEASTVRFRSFP